MRPADSSPSPYSAFPVRKSAVGSPERSMDAARLTDSVDGRGGGGTTGSSATTPPSVQATSAGTINVAICPGAVREAAIASEASRPSTGEVDEVRNHLEN